MTGGGHLWVRWGTFGFHKCGEFLDQQRSLLVSFSRRTLLHGVSKYIYIYICRKLLDGLKERRGYSHLKEEALDHTMWRAGFGRGFGPVVRQTTKWYIYIYIYICRKLLDDLKERRGYSHLKEEALDRNMWRARFGRGFGPVVRQTTIWYIYIYI